MEDTYPVIIALYKNVLVRVKIVLVFIVFVGLPNKTCSDEYTLDYQNDAKARKR